MGAPLRQFGAEFRRLAERRHLWQAFRLGSALVLYVAGLPLGEVFGAPRLASVVVGAYVYAVVAVGLAQMLFVETVSARRWLPGLAAAAAFAAALAYGATLL